jgi:AcrR family transcriptional regulator
MGNTREAILRAARSEFERGGLDGTSLRSIARGAQVDPALLLHYFGSKEELFVASVRDAFARHMERVVSAPGVSGSLGERLVGAFLTAWDAPESSEVLVALLRAGLTNERVSGLMTTFFQSELPALVSARIGPQDADLRVGLVATQLLGLALTRYVLRLRPVAEMSRDDLVGTLGPTVTRYLTGPLPTGGREGRPRRGRARS